MAIFCCIIRMWAVVCIFLVCPKKQKMQQEIGKRPYQHFFIVLAMALAGLVVVLLLRRWMFGF